MAAARFCSLEDASVTAIPFLAGLPERIAERKLGKIKLGAQLKDELALFPSARSCKDAICLLILLGCFLMLMAASVRWKLQYQEPATIISLREPGSRTDTMPTMRMLSEETEEDTVTRNGYLTSATFSILASALVALAAIQSLYLMAETVLLSCTWLRPMLKLTLSLLTGLYALYIISLEPAGKAAGLMQEVSFGLYTVLSVVYLAASTCDFCVGCAMRASSRNHLNLQTKLMRSISNIVSETSMFVVPGLCTLVFFVCLSLMLWAFIWLLHSEQLEAFLLPCLLLLTWGAGTVVYVCSLATNGLYARWYHQQPRSLVQSLRTALCSSGSAALAAFLAPCMRVAQLLSRQLQSDGPSCANPFQACLTLTCGCIFNGPISTLADVAEFANTWTFPQIAVRNASFCESAIITTAFCTCSSVVYLKRGVLLNFVTGATIFASGLLGFAIGAIAEYTGGYPWLYLCPALGLICATITAAIVMSIVKTGFKALLVMWSEHPEKLVDLDRDAHDSLCESIARSWSRPSATSAEMRQMIFE